MNNQHKGIVVISGASTGIGRASALLLDKSGYRVFAGVRTKHAAESLCEEASSRLTPLVLDIINPEHIQKAYQIVSDRIDRGERLTALFNNAGYTEAGPLEFIPIEKLRYQTDVNLFGHFSMIQEFMPLIRKHRARIINTGSPAGFFSSPFIGAYSISKHALTAMNDTFRRELKPWGISVVLIIPGFINTPIWDKSYSEMDRLMDDLPNQDRNKYQSAIINGRRFMDTKGRARGISPEQVASKILQAIEDKHPKSIYFAGIDGYFSFGIGKFVPQCIVDFVTARILAGRF